MTRIMIADDHLMFVDGITALLEKEKVIVIAGHALNGRELLAMLEKKKADIVLLDVNMPEMDGMETMKHLKHKFPDVKVIMLTTHNSHDMIYRLIHAGAAGYILKNTGKKELVEAIQAVHGGKTWYSEEVKEVIMQNIAQPREQKLEAVSLSEREKEVLTLIAGEFTTQEIAAQLFISVSTVETHRRNLMIKLSVKNLAGLVKFALQTGLIS